MEQLFSILLGFMEQLAGILLDVEFLKWAIPLLGATVAWFTNEGLNRRQYKWELKRDACLEALQIVDSHFSHQEWGGGLKAEEQEKPDIKTARDTYNKLCLSCKRDDVLQSYKKCLGLSGPFNAGDIVDLRNAIREELGFGGDFDNDRERAWIGQLNKPDETHSTAL